MRTDLLAISTMSDAQNPMAIDTKGQMLLRIAELRQMRDEAAARGATLTVRQLDKMLTKAETDLRDQMERDEEACRRHRRADALPAIA